MMTEVPRRFRSWFGENQALVFFLSAQAIAGMTAGAALLTYMVQLENRTHTMETRGAHYTVARMDEMKQRITVLEQQIAKNAAQIERVVTLLTRDVGK
jgi:cell division protein FtsB